MSANLQIISFLIRIPQGTLTNAWLKPSRTASLAFQPAKAVTPSTCLTQRKRRDPFISPPNCCRLILVPGHKRRSGASPEGRVMEEALERGGWTERSEEEAVLEMAASSGLVL